jgi:hypothetical protein
MKKTTAALAVLLLTQSAPIFACTGPGCGEIKAPAILAAVAKMQVQKVVNDAAERVKQIGHIPLEAAGILTLLPYADEPVPADAAETMEKAQAWIKQRTKFWQAVAEVLEKDSAGDQDLKSDSLSVEPMKEKIKSHALAKKAALIVADSMADQKYIDSMAKDADHRSETGQQVIDRKKALFEAMIPAAKKADRTAHQIFKPWEWEKILMDIPRGVVLSPDGAGR